MPTLETPTAPAPARKRPGVEYIEYDRYIDQQVRKTRQAVKFVDLAHVFLLLAVGLLGFFLAAAVVEHWILPGGLGAFGRVGLFMLLVGGLGYYLVRCVWPILTRPINPAYAAQAIEREHPLLKNSLINFLLFRRERATMPPAVFDALEEQAAQRLSQTSIEDSVDRGPLIKLGYVLLAVTVAAVLYAVVSPKSSMATAARVLMPWADIAAPSRVQITNIEPGHVEVVEGESLEISAQIAGLRPGERVRLEYDTSDGQRTAVEVPMLPANDAGKYACQLPPPDDAFGSVGIEQDLRYRIVAGDGQSIDYKVHVVTAPTIRVRRVFYDFPDYTGYVDRNVTDRGDIRAIEGTKVTIFAEANCDIESAHLDLAADGRFDKRMRVDGREAQVEHVLELSGDRRTSRTTSYMLRLTSTEGLENLEPPQHAIEILPDYPPEVDIIAPAERVLDVQLNETVTLEIDARDPDFALARVRLRMEKTGGGKVIDEQLLAERHEGRWIGQYKFTPADHDLKPGDVVNYWVEASDVREPQANIAKSVEQQFRIVGPPAGQEQQQQDGQQQGEPTSAGGDQPGEPQQDGQQQGEPASAGGQPSEGAEGGEGGEGGEGAEGEDSQPVAKDDSDYTSAFEKIQRHLNEQEQQNATRNRGEGQPEREQEQGAGQQDAQQGPDQQQNGERREGAEAQEGTQPQQGADQQDGEQQEASDSQGEATSEAQQQPGDPDGQGQQGEPASAGGQPEQDSQSTSGDPRTDENQRGAGQEETPGGTPEAQREQAQRERRPDEGSPDDMESTEPPAPGHSRHESDSRGEEGGTASGGGEEGGGQDTPREGTGSDGQNQAADEGGGTSADEGPGEPASADGNQQQAAGETGEAGEEQGEGSTMRPSDDSSSAEQPSDDQASDDPASQGREPSGDNASQQERVTEEGAGEQASEPSPDGQQSDRQQPPDNGQDSRQPPQGDPSAPGGSKTGGPEGMASDRELPDDIDRALAEGDEANLEYARKQTDMVLEKLSDQLDKGNVDKDLLDDLGWSQEDLRRFVDRWQKLREDAARPDASEAQQELDARLRNLGEALQPSTSRTLRQQDDFRDLREGYQNQVPLKFRDRLKAYTEGVSKSREE